MEEHILLFEFNTFTAKNGTEYIKTLMITTTEAGGYNGYTSFNTFDLGLPQLVSTPDFRDNLRIYSISFIGKFGNSSRYSVLFEYLNVDGVPQMLNVIYDKIY